MIRPRQALRLIHINFVLVRHGLDEIVLAAHIMRPFRFLLYLSPWRWFRRNPEPQAVRLREALEDLGPIFVKFGQMLSTRRDLLSADFADELAHLQDRVPPFPGREARLIVERALGAPVTETFLEFDETPLASASIAQVHAATLKDNRKVVVKVLRPGVERVIRGDIELLYLIAGLAERYWKDGRRLRPREVVAEYEKTIFDELDLMREAANAAALRRNFADSELIYIPYIDWPHTRRNVMVMERISGIPVSDIAALRERGTDMRVLSERGVEVFFTQVFRDNFFHADMHPGNIFVDATDPQDPRYIAVDFGIVGTLNPRDQHYLAANFVAFFNRDYRRVAELHVESGWVPPGTRVDEFESAIRTVCEPIFNRPLKDISFGQLLLRLFQTARRFNMEVQPQLVLLQKTLLNIEGLGRELYPDLDLWQTAKPFLEDWMREQMGGRAAFKRLRGSLPGLGDRLQEVPQLAYEVLQKAADGTLTLRMDTPSVDRLREELRAGRQRQHATISGAALTVSGTIMVAAAVTPWWLGWLLGGLGLGLLLVSGTRR